MNFHTSANDTLFHYDVRFFQKDTAIVVNSRYQGTWQKEERLQNTIPRNRLFRIDVQITPTGLIITQDQMRPYSFNYRHGLTPDKIRNISIEGNIRIKRVFYGVRHFQCTCFHEMVLCKSPTTLDGNRTRTCRIMCSLCYPLHHMSG